MAKIIVTGAAGFIGSHLSQALLHSGHAVFGVDSLNDYYPASLKRFNLSFPSSHKRFTFRKWSILDESKMFQLVKDVKPDYLIHAAAYAGVRASLKDPLIYTKTNVLGTQILLEALRLHSSRTKCILFSSSSVYGVQKKTPFTEGMTPSPSSPYGASKYAMELVAAQYAKFYGIGHIILRLFSIYGPRGRVDMAPMLAIRAAERGRIFYQYGTNANNERDWTYVADVVEAIEKMVKLKKFPDWQILNIGNSKPVGISDFVAVMAKLCKQYLQKDLRVHKVARGDEELPITYADTRAAKKLLGYAPHTSFEDGMEALFTYYVENRALYKPVFLK